MFLRDVVGAPAYMAGKTRHIAGVEAQGDRLTIHLTARAPDLPARLAISLFCAVPTDTPNRPVSGALPSAGPYYVASATPGRSFVLLRNPNYHGNRPHRLQRIEIIVGASHPVAEIEASKLDYVIGGVPAGESARLERLYGAHSAAAGRGRQRYFVNRTPSVDYLDLNTRRPLFASERMRRAASYAVDRSALAATGGSFTTAAAPAQMSLPPGIPGYRDAHVYPLVPDLASARRLAGSGHRAAELYCVLEGGGPQAAQIIKNNLAAIGIDVHVHCMPGDGFFTRMFRPNEPWDIAIDGYGANYNDPGEFINGLATDNEFNFTHYHDPEAQPRDPRRLTPLRHSPRPGLRQDRPGAHARHGALDQLRQRNPTGLLLRPHRLPALPADGRHGSRRPLHPDGPRRDRFQELRPVALSPHRIFGDTVRDGTAENLVGLNSTHPLDAHARADRRRA